MHFYIEKRENPALFNDIVWMSKRLNDLKRTPIEKLNQHIYYDVDLNMACVMHNIEIRCLTGVNELSLFAEMREACPDSSMLMTYVRQRQTIVLPIYQDQDICRDIKYRLESRLHYWEKDNLLCETAPIDGSEVTYAKLASLIIRMLPEDLTFNFFRTSDLPSDLYSIEYTNGLLRFKSDTRCTILAGINIKSE